MEIEKTITKSLPFNNNTRKSADYSEAGFDFSVLIGSLKQEKKWKNGEMNMKVLLRSPVKKIVLAILHGNTEILSHQVNDSIAFRIIEGKLTVHYGRKSISLISGEQLILSEKTRYTVDSREDTAFLMTLLSRN